MDTASAAASGFRINLAGGGESASPSPAPTGGAAAHQVNAARDDATRELGKRPYRKRRDSVERDDQHALQAKVNEAIAAQLDQLYDPKNFAAILCLPADAALTLTGNARWRFSDEERATLGSTGAAAARTLMITNPRGLAFAMLGAALVSAYVPRAVAQLREMREADAAKASKGKSDAAT